MVLAILVREAKRRGWFGERPLTQLEASFSALFSAPIMATRPLLIAILVACAVLGVSAMVPLPQTFTYGQGTVNLSPSARFHSASHSAILQAALSRIHSQIFIFNTAGFETKWHLNVTVKSDAETLEYGVGTFLLHSL